ncbi:PQQ-like domain-containing protein [Bryocella elongata]|uniref:PQQ-like domain-containing protein n=1 Tax=Bryocella elongata TaxID=863522 RepID=A0A1H6C9L5_9BACT|nr:PQQ-binding-like beta-propeller repeat protein [Bryocella elongata]SEG69056.1 PQQ-like domain-containing protein [Bryocella elongata]
MIIRYLTAAILLHSSLTARAQVDVLTQHNDPARTGSNLRETTLAPDNVNVRQFGMLFKQSVDDQVYSQPLLVSNLAMSDGTHDVVYVTTVNNSVYAFDANEPNGAAPIWHVNFGTPASLSDGKFGCADINGSMGIIGTPVIDRARHALYVVALTKSSTGYAQRLHALDLATGADLLNSPVIIRAQAFDALAQNQRPALALSHGMIYVGYASHCDKEPYHGFLLAYDQGTLQQVAALNTTPTGSEGSIWQSGQAPAIDAAGNLYVVTGNGSWDGKANFGESFLRLSPQLKVLDYFTPTNHLELDRKDNDLNSSGATLIPGTPFVLGGGKTGIIYVLDRDHLGHLGDEHAVEHFAATVSHLHSIVYWKSDANGGLLYMWGQRDRAKVYRLRDGMFTPAPAMSRTDVNDGHPGAMLSLSANGGADGILWAAIHATGDSWHESRPGILHAFDANDINRELWNSLQNPQRDDCGEYSKMAPPTIANGRVYLASFGTANTGTGQLCVYGLLPSGPPPSAPQHLSAAATPNRVILTWNSSPDARTYTVIVADANSQAVRVIGRGLTTPRFVDESALDGHTYQYRVVAANTNGPSQSSGEVSVSLPRSHTSTHTTH